MSPASMPSLSDRLARGLIARADRAMYRAKQDGRNQVIPIEGK